MALRSSVNELGIRTWSDAVCARVGDVLQGTELLGPSEPSVLGRDLTIALKDDRWIIAVSDNGIGFDEAYAEQAWD